MDEVLEQRLSEMVLWCAFRVHNALGPGLLEAVYEEAMCVELGTSGILFERQRRFPVYYRGVCIGEYVADLVVEGKIILELKAVKRFSEVMEAQLINYLKISGLHVGYLLNFSGSRLGWKRFVKSG